MQSIFPMTRVPLPNNLCHVDHNEGPVKHVLICAGQFHGLYICPDTLKGNKPSHGMYLQAFYGHEGLTLPLFTIKKPIFCTPCNGGI